MRFRIALSAIIFYNKNWSPIVSVRKLQKVTYSLPEELIDRVRSVVREGAAPSYSAFVEQALADRVRRAHEEKLAAEFRTAGSDPGFLADVGRALGAFEPIDERPKREQM
jgi:Arc/MetJ-type ribon-helix-helix transcriptional regulator